LAQPEKFSVRFTKSARKEFESLPERIKRQALEALSLLAANPWTELLQVKKLKGAEALYRVRLGDYRLVFEIQKQELVVLVIRIGHRKEVYR
jgi:mRNA interferase RelE/StbE